MATFTTQGNVYITDQAGEWAAFRIPRGERAGQLYGFLGCYDPNEHSLELALVKDHVMPRILETSRMLEYCILDGIQELKVLGETTAFMPWMNPWVSKPLRTFIVLGAIKNL